MECKHIKLKKYKDRSIYVYDLAGDKEEIRLCPDCHMLLAGQIMQQLATEVFLDASALGKINIKEAKRCPKKTKKK